mgnify:CR=1 FL=1
MPRISFEGPDGAESYDLPLGPNGLLRLQLAEVRHVQRVADLTIEQLQTRIFTLDPTALTAIVQVLWKRAGRIVKWDDVDFDVSTIDFDLLDGEGPDEEADPADAGALVEDPSQASSTEPTEAG